MTLSARALGASAVVALVTGASLFQFHQTKLVMVPCTGEWAGPACDALARIETSEPFIPAPYIVVIALGVGVLAYWLLTDGRKTFRKGQRRG